MKITTIGNNLKVSTQRGTTGIFIERLKEVNKSFYEKWRDALLSEEYKQVQGALYQADLEEEESYYCCLGVIGKIYGYTDTLLEKQGLLKDISTKIVRVPKRVRNSTTFNSFFVHLNDNLELSFKEIAEVLTYIIDNKLYKED